MMDINNNNVHFITSNKVRTSSVRKCFVTEVELKRREGGTHRGIPLEMVLCSSFQISQYSLLSSKSSTSPSSTRRIFTFLNDLRSCATRNGQSHCALSDDRLHILCSRVRCSISEYLWSSSLKICLMEDTCEASEIHGTCTRRTYASASSQGYTSTSTLPKKNLALRFSVVFENCRTPGRRGTEDMISLKKIRKRDVCRSVVSVRASCFSISWWEQGRKSRSSRSREFPAKA